MRYKKLLLVPMVLSLLTMGLPAAHADLYTGVCAIQVNVNFDQPISATSGAVSYSIDARNYYIDPHLSERSGIRPDTCVIDANALSPFRSMSAWGRGDAVIWNCESAVSFGTWDQDFYPDPDGVVGGAHSITGTWDDWTMDVEDDGYNFVGVAHLTLAAREQAKASDCLGGISSLAMVGVMVFQDP